jgi:pimeloyl-ACP methyl ester carboxylesterase
VESGLTTALAGFQYKVASYGSWFSINAGGTNTFGNDTAIAAIQGTVDLLTAEGRPGPYLLAGHSMGWCDLMNWARLNPTRVKGAMCMYGLMDLNEQFTANRALGDGNNGTAVINAAYGGAYDPVAMGPTRSPAQFIPTTLSDKPMWGFVAMDDPLVPPQSLIDFDTANANFTLKTFPTGGHASPTVQQALLTTEFATFMSQMAA